MTLSYAKAIKGKRAYNKCPFNRGGNVTLISAIALSGLIASLNAKEVLIKKLSIKFKEYVYRAYKLI